jgi:hypothetical protein
VNAKSILMVGLAVFVGALMLAGCGRDNFTNPAQAPIDPIVFDDDFGAAVDYQAFAGSKTDAVQMDFSTSFNGPASLRVTVPGPGDPTGTFAGGAFTTYNVRDLSPFNALTFYAKAEMDATLNIAGLGNDNTGTSLYQSSRNNIPLTTDWQKVVIPIPNPSRLTTEGGLFFFAEGYENDQQYDFYMDEVKFETVSTITDPRPAIATTSQTTFVGGSVDIGDGTVTFDVAGEDVVIDCFAACLEYDSSDSTVATVSEGVISAVGSGTATITARLDTVVGTGAVTVNVLGAPDGPATTPTVAESLVISLFSGAYDDVTVDTWRATWSTPTIGLTDFQIEGDDVKVYSNSVLGAWYAGIEFTSEVIDASDMTHIHLDVWAPSGGLFRVKLVDFGADGLYGGAPDSEYELTFNGGTTPPFFSGQWSSLEIPLANFVGLVSREHVAQIVISSSDVPTAIVDNVYFHR